MQNSNGNSQISILAVLKSEEGKRQELLDLLIPHMNHQEKRNVIFLMYFAHL